MKNLSFAEKNNFVVKNKSGNYFSKDLELFKKHFPIHKLNNELARANSFTYDRLDGQMLYTLLEKVSPEEILTNRKEETKTTDLLVETPPVEESQSPETVTENSTTEETKSTQEDSSVENLKGLEERIVDLEEKNDINEDEISDLRSDLEEKDTSIEELNKKIEALGTKALNKKKVNKKNSPQ